MKKNLIIVLITALITTIICCIVFYFISNSGNSNNDTQDVSTQPTEKNLNIEDNTSNENKSDRKAEKEKVYDIEGYELAGTIEIPKINVNNNISTKVTSSSIKYNMGILFSTKHIEHENDISTDNTLNEIGNTVLLGGPTSITENLHKLLNGDQIIIKDYNTDNTITYEIYDIFYTRAEDTDFYKRDTNSKREITISAVNMNSNARIKEENNPRLRKERLVILAKEIK